jgi:hypothetical protein
MTIQCWPYFVAFTGKPVQSDVWRRYLELATAIAETGSPGGRAAVIGSYAG